MKHEDLLTNQECEYCKTCDCGKKLVVFTQEDNFPEYHTEVYVKCECGDYVEFILPVN